MLKCLIHSYAVGPELSRFAFDFLMHEHRPFHIHDGAGAAANGAFSSAVEASRALRDFAGKKADAIQNVCRREQWQNSPYNVAEAGLVETFVDFGFLPRSALLSEGGDPSSFVIASQADADAFVIKCARHALLESRRSALNSFKQGFEARDFPPGAEALDITIHLALFTPAEACSLVCGTKIITCDDLYVCRLLNGHSA